MKIGIDIHGVIDKFPQLFSKLTKEWSKQGHEIHIITGQSWSKASLKVDSIPITYHKHYSIIDFHLQKQTEMWIDEKGGWAMSADVWNNSKGNYCKDEGIDIHFDDELSYAKNMPESCSFILVGKNFSIGSLLS